MLPNDPVNAWLARVHHDLVKRLLWTARDCRELGRSPLPGELLATLYGAEGEAVDAAMLWAQLREDVPAGDSHDAILDAFGAAVEHCVGAALRNDLDGVLHLEFEFEGLRAALASSLKGTPASGLTPGKSH